MIRHRHGGPKVRYHTKRGKTRYRKRPIHDHRKGKKKNKGPTFIKSQKNKRRISYEDLIKKSTGEEIKKTKDGYIFINKEIENKVDITKPKIKTKLDNTQRIRSFGNFLYTSYRVSENISSFLLIAKGGAIALIANKGLNLFLDKLLDKLKEEGLFKLINKNLGIDVWGILAETKLMDKIRTTLSKKIEALLTDYPDYKTNEKDYQEINQKIVYIVEEVVNYYIDNEKSERIQRYFPNTRKNKKEEILEVSKLEDRKPNIVYGLFLNKKLIGESEIIYRENCFIIFHLEIKENERNKRYGSYLVNWLISNLAERKGYKTIIAQWIEQYLINWLTNMGFRRMEDYDYKKYVLEEIRYNDQKEEELNFIKEL